jgi:hypothetical protein
VLVAAADERNAILIKHAEVANERLQATTVARRRDHGIRLDPGFVGEQHVPAVKAGNRRNDLDLSRLEEADEPIVVRGRLLPLEQGCGEPVRRAWKSVLLKVAEQDPL